MNEALLKPAFQIRTLFSESLSDMYRTEVPQYGTLVDMVEHINQQVLESTPGLQQTLSQHSELKRISSERHGAIRVGTARELSTMRRLFAVMGMYPVAYYDLTEAGIPVHSTAFRPIDQSELNANPFRIFTSLLRLDLISDEALRQQAKDLLWHREIFTPALIKLIEIFERQKGLNTKQAEEFIQQARHIFRWHPQANVDLETHQRFVKAHNLIADIVCFKGPHINHLTPRTLNIDQAQQQMAEYGLNPKAIIEGPPRRQHPVLLRQTSFRALSEKVDFKSRYSETQTGQHTARFGEIEQRGMALTPKGRALYDSLLDEVRFAVPNPDKKTDEYYRQLETTFERFPDDLNQIHQQRLGYFTYTTGVITPENPPANLDLLVTNNIVAIHPVTYEDFLPVSAAGIFRSNLAQRDSQDFARSPNLEAFENDLGCPVINEFELYQKIQKASLKSCLDKLGFSAGQCRQIIHQLSV